MLYPGSAFDDVTQRRANFDSWVDSADPTEVKSQFLIHLNAVLSGTGLSVTEEFTLKAPHLPAQKQDDVLLQVNEFAARNGIKERIVATLRSSPVRCHEYLN
jgi:hypothetical protein